MFIPALFRYQCDICFDTQRYLCRQLNEFNLAPNKKYNTKAENLNTVLKFILFLSLVVAFVWHFSPVNQQEKLVDISSTYIKTFLFDDASSVEIKQRIKKAKTILFEKNFVIEKELTFSNDQTKSPLFNEFMIKQNFKQACGRTKTQVLSEVKGPSIYKSQNESGVVEFSDKPSFGASNVGDLIKETKYFNLNLRFSDNKNRPFYRDRISADSRKLFLLLSEQLQVKNLRQINLNVSLFSSLSDFERYKEKVAPGLKTNSGFYTSLNNEASIVMRRDRRETLAVVRHEAVHVIMAGLYGPTPTWFNEGLAEYFENLEIHTMAAHIPANMDSFKLLRQLSSNHTLPKINDYLGLTEKQWREGDQATMYALGWGMIYFLMADEKNRNFLSSLMKSLFDHACQPFSSQTFFESNYPGGITVFQSTFDTWLLQGKAVTQHY